MIIFFFFTTTHFATRDASCFKIAIIVTPQRPRTPGRMLDACLLSRRSGLQLL